ncbi:uncharacterized protein LOC119689708 [Teleopsis dalmanni]|uniref:uncharacterized protein LOC119689708 n=1 Tax=Teleopsis dalmanni TaxID=139649 RepID=UPI0018CD8193|nr:uncharacterized protein LOC119689708 [Teleopsis dalmanni]
MESKEMLNGSKNVVKESPPAAGVSWQNTPTNAIVVKAENPVNTVKASEQLGVDVNAKVSTVSKHVDDHQSIRHISQPNNIGEYLSKCHTIGYDAKMPNKHKINNEINKSVDCGKQMNGNQFFNAGRGTLANTGGQISRGIQLDKPKISSLRFNNSLFSQQSNNGFTGTGQMLGYSVSGIKNICDWKPGALVVPRNVIVHEQEVDDRMTLDAKVTQVLSQQALSGMSTTKEKLGEIVLAENANLSIMKIDDQITAKNECRMNFTKPISHRSDHCQRKLDGTVMNVSTKVFVPQFPDRIVVDAKHDQALNNQEINTSTISEKKLGSAVADGDTKTYVQKFVDQLTIEVELRPTTDNQIPKTSGFFEGRLGCILESGDHTSYEQNCSYCDRKSIIGAIDEMQLIEYVAGANVRGQDHNFIDKIALGSDLKRKPRNKIANVNDFGETQLVGLMMDGNSRVHEQKDFEKTTTGYTTEHRYCGLKVTLPNVGKQTIRCIELKEQSSAMQSLHSSKMNNKNEDYLNVVKTKEIDKRTGGLKFFQEDIIRQTPNNVEVEQKNLKVRKLLKKKKAAKKKFVSPIEFESLQYVEQNLDDVISIGHCDVFGTPLFGQQTRSNDIISGQPSEANDIRIAEKTSYKQKNEAFKCDDKEFVEINLLKIGQVRPNSFKYAEHVDDEMCEAVELGEVRYIDHLVDSDMNDKRRDDYFHGLRVVEEQAEDQKTINHVLCDQYTKFFTIDEQNVDNSIYEQDSDDVHEIEKRNKKKPKALERRIVQDKMCGFLKTGTDIAQNTGNVVTGKQSNEAIIEELFLNGEYCKSVHENEQTADCVTDIDVSDVPSDDGLTFDNTAFNVAYSGSETDAYGTVTASETETDTEETDTDTENTEYEDFYQSQESDEWTEVEGLLEMEPDDCEESEDETDGSEYSNMTDTEESDDGNAESDDSTTIAFTDGSGSDFDSEIDLQQFFDSEYNSEYSKNYEE